MLAKGSFFFSLKMHFFIFIYI